MLLAGVIAVLLLFLKLWLLFLGVTLRVPVLCVLASLNVLVLRIARVSPLLLLRVPLDVASVPLFWSSWCLLVTLLFLLANELLGCCLS